VCALTRARASTSNARSRIRTQAAALREHWGLALIILALVILAVVYVSAALSRPEPTAFAATGTAQLVTDSAGKREYRATIEASAENRWRFFSLRTGSIVDNPGHLDWDLAFRRFHIATNGGPGFAGQGSAGIEGQRGQPVALRQTSADSTTSGFGKWYDYGFSSHLLSPKPLTYEVHAADGTPYRLRILSYYCPGAAPGCITVAYSRK
jgi:hypothetical protein